MTALLFLLQLTAPVHQFNRVIVSCSAVKDYARGAHRGLFGCMYQL
jgi:hypothetical protein